jgi:hypothetical protein
MNRRTPIRLVLYSYSADAEFVVKPRTGRGTRPSSRVAEPTSGENTAENLHGGVCEGGEVSVAMVDLHAHEAGNGG